MKIFSFALMLLWWPLAMGQDTTQAESGNGPGKLEFAEKVYKSIEKSEVSVEVVRTGGQSGAVTVQVVSRDLSGQSGRDYEPLNTQLTFADGDSAPKTVTVKVLGDNALELPESFALALENPSGGAQLGNIATTKVKIVMISNDAVVLGILMILLAGVFATSHSERPGLKKFYKFVPSLLMCYFLPSVFSTLGIFSPDHSKIYFVASRFLLPACLVLLCLSIDIKGILALGPKALIMFFTGTAGIMIGGPLAIAIVSMISPETVGGEGADSVWRGMTTVAGSWIGGGANQTAMKEVFGVGDRIFSAMIAVDIIVANLWMAVILYMAGESDVFDKKLKADNSAIKTLQQKIADYQAQIAQIPNLTDLMKILGIGFAVTAFGHFMADIIGPLITEKAPYLEKVSLTSKFFWLIVIATLGGFLLSFTKARKYEGVGASRVGSAFLYVLVASIGMKMDLTAIFHNPGLFVVGAIWISFHAVSLLVVAKLIKAPVFFLAVGSQANVGGAASAPIVASAFHPSLAPVGVLLAVFGYGIGTFGAWLCGLMMQAVAGG